MFKFICHKHSEKNLNGPETKYSCFVFTKGQIKPKADWWAVDSPKKRRNKFVLFAFLLFTANKTNLFIRFFLRIYGTPKLLSVLSDLLDCNVFEWTNFKTPQSNGINMSSKSTKITQFRFLDFSHSIVGCFYDQKNSRRMPLSAGFAGRKSWHVSVDEMSSEFLSKILQIPGD